MASGKSALLVNRIDFLKSLKKEVSVLMHAASRPGELYVASRAGQHEYGLRFRSPDELMRYARTSEFLAIDEIQDLDFETYRSTIDELLKRGRMIICAGRNKDFRGREYPIMKYLSDLAKPDRYTKLTALCAVCLGPATRSQRLICGLPASKATPTSDLEVAYATYEPRCRDHHLVPDS
jgi:thymidine kinase